MSPEENVYATSLIAGGIAGLVVDVSLFPLDTLKTRLQASQGFFKAGGFKHIYKGIGPQAIGSIPQAALFFCTYESFKVHTTPLVHPTFIPLIHMAGASISEVVACLVRVPVEIVKQRRQTTIGESSLSILRKAYRHGGFIGGLYRGFGSTVFREIPFSLIQFPIYEFLKVTCSNVFMDGKTISSWQAGLSGAIAGGIAAAATTPLDVAKTRIMLAETSRSRKLTIHSVLKSTYNERGVPGLFAGFVPRVLWITLGGAIFFGAYDQARKFTQIYLLENTTNHKR